jgi:ribosomal protein S18 acetylase RimI-like enzyme
VPADRPSAAAARTLLAHAFADDPLFGWIFPDRVHRLQAMAAWLGVAVERYLAGGSAEAVHEDGALTGVALWRSPAAPATGDADVLPTPDGLLTALTGAAHAAEVGRGFAAAREALPPAAEPHAYLHFLAVAPGAQGRGHGGRLLRTVLDRAAGMVLRLDTTNPANLAFYRSHGLEVRHEARLGPTGPTIWTLETAGR